MNQTFRNTKPSESSHQDVNLFLYKIEIKDFKIFQIFLSYFIQTNNEKLNHTPQKKTLTITPTKAIANTNAKDKDKEEDKGKADCDNKIKIFDKLKTTAKIKRPVTAIKSNANKVISTGYETNVPSSASKSPLASNFATEKPASNKDKKTKESKDDFNLKNKRPIYATLEIDKKDKTHRIDKKEPQAAGATNHLETDGNHNHNNTTLTAKKSAAKIGLTSKQKQSNETKDAHNTLVNHNESNATETKTKKEKLEKQEKLKDKKENKTIGKIDKKDIGNILSIFFIFLNIKL